MKGKGPSTTETHRVKENKARRFRAPYSYEITSTKELLQQGQLP